MAMPKGNRWEDMIRPLTELGVNQMIPLLTDRTEFHVDEKKMSTKFLKWEKIARDACKQSGNPWMPTFKLPAKLSTLLENIKAEEAVLMGSLSKSAKPMKKVKLKCGFKITILIGPEGGWSEEEEKISVQCGVVPFNLGVNTLRLENAAVASLAVARERFIL